MKRQGLGEYTIEQCQDFRQDFYSLYKVLRRYLWSQRDFMQKYNCLISECGRIRRLPEIKLHQYLDYKRRKFTGPLSLVLNDGEQATISSSEAYKRASKKYRHAVKQGYNFPIQSLGASITKRAMVELDNQGFELVTQVHDSIICEVNKDGAWEMAKKAQEIMETVYPLSVPLVAEPKLLKSMDEKHLYEEE